jgi:hypothetical protein
LNFGCGIANRVSCPAADVQEADARFDVEKGERLPLHPTKVVKASFVERLGASVPLASVSLFVFPVRRCWRNFWHNLIVALETEKHKSGVGANFTPWSVSSMICMEGP